MSTGDSNRSLMAKTRTSRQLNLYKALVIKDQGVTASGLSAINSGSTQFGTGSRDPAKDPALDVANFGKTLMNAIGKSNRLGTSETDESSTPPGKN
jgi:thermitase